MRSRFTYAALALALTVVACDRDAPTSANTPDNQPAEPSLKPDRGNLLRDIPVTGTSVPITNPAATPAPFTGTLTVTKFNYDQATGQLLVSGTITDANGQTDTFTDQPATLTKSGAPSAPVCQILNLDIGRITLNLLGLVVDLAPISLDVTGVTGPGNLLGNLLCALTGLLDPPGPLAAILNLIDQINAILAGL
jgi:hypothetical protein